ncbi:TIR domain-containing protein [Streptomyces sp. WI04-05B]|uniref:TIR domain-containing protein n=1 Tax=Streptomyces TaxID=1883 RepID=UPI0029B7D45B|nr:MULTISPECIES: TIR domain-containing protein [unclassified Streptomyces]MDX2545421.1 TIR domain-containing protein [Streptomyces sp. WI04-05B]MDX2581808.1 TIR domain-containing protein [Streptomyces sp. WI04-05A]
MDTPGQTTAPIAFLSHASEDKQGFTEPLGRELARLGVQPWLDKWEIKPGDSLVQRLFDEGLARADAVVVVVSQHSAGKPWVREELDSATVHRIERGTRLIPVRLDGAPVPEPLQHLVWITAQRTPEDLRRVAQEISAVLHEHDSRPAVGPAPAYTTTSSAVPGLTRSDSFLLTELVREALEGEHLFPVDWQAVKSRVEDAGLTNNILNESLHALAEEDYIDITSRSGRIVVDKLTSAGFAAGLPALISDVEVVHQRIIAAIVNDPPSGDRIIDDLAQRTGASRVVVDELLNELEWEGQLSVSRTLGNHSRLQSVSPTLRRRLLGES